MSWRETLGKRIQDAREAQRYSVKSAAEAAPMSRDTWAKIERGLSVQDVKLRAARDLLGLDEQGMPVGGGTQDAQEFVESLSGERVIGGVTNEDLLREILRSRAESDRMAGRIEGVETSVEALSDRVAKLEESGA